MTASPTTLYLQDCLNRLRAGEPAARANLLRHSQERLRTLTHRMLAGFPHVKRFEQTDDVLQNVNIRLTKMLDRMVVESVSDYLHLAAANLRRELIDLSRHYYGPLGLGANQAQGPLAALDKSDGPPPNHRVAESGNDALTLADWTEFHERAAQLPEDERAVFDLLWYQGLTKEEAAALVGVSPRTVTRRWQAARLNLMTALGGKAKA